MTVLTATDLSTDDREHPEDALTRDRWGRPEINRPDGSGKTGYRRASSFGSPLESDFNLQLWAKRQVARGISRREDLAIAVTRAEVDLDHPDPRKSRAAKKELDRLAEAAMEAVQSGAKATIGTAAHHIYERIDLGLDPGHVSPLLTADLAAYRTLVTPRFRMVSVERFVVHDGLKVAGTLDRAAELLCPMTTPDGTVLPVGMTCIADVKTSQDMSFAGCKFAVQCYVYAAGTPYNTATGVREEWGHGTPSTEWALIIHAPSGQGTAALYWVDLTGAKEAAEHALCVHDWRGSRGKGLISRAEVVEIEEDFFEIAANAESTDILTAAYYRAEAAGKWNDVLKQAFSRRKLELVAEAS
jgi:hypothetical protein